MGEKKLRRFVFIEFWVGIYIAKNLFLLDIRQHVATIVFCDA
jgi:hypothetical protein